MSAPSLSTQQQQLLSVIAATQQPESRAAAERSLEESGAAMPQYALLLLSMLQPSLQADVGADQQLLIAIMLKKYVKLHWSEGSDAFVPPLVPEAEKVKFHGLLLPMLDTQSTKLRRQLAATISEVAEADFPERWTSLLPDVLSVLSTPNASSVLTNGCMRVMVEFAESMTDEQLMQTIPKLFPILLAQCEKKCELLLSCQRTSPIPQLTQQQAQEVNDSMQFCIDALRIYRSCCTSLLNTNDMVNSQDRASSSASAAKALDRVLDQFLVPSLQTWFAFLSALIAVPSQGSLDFAEAYPMVWGLRLEAVSTLGSVYTSFEDQLLSRGLEGAKVYEQHLTLLMDTMSACYPTFERKVLHARVDGDGLGDIADNEVEAEEDSFDDDGNAINMSAFLYACFNVIRGVCSISKPIKPSAKKAAKKGKAPKVDPKAGAFEYLLQMLSTRGTALPRLVTLVSQYALLSSREIASSLGEVEEFLANQDSDDELVGQSCNVRQSARDLLLGTLLYQADGDADDMLLGGMSGGAGGTLGGCDLVDRTLVIQLLCPIITQLLTASGVQRQKGENKWWKSRELATLLLAHVVDEVLVLQMPTPAKGKTPAREAKGANFDLPAFVREVLLPDLTTGGQAHPLLHTQTLMSTSRFVPVFMRVKESNLVVTALEALVANMAPKSGPQASDLLVRISAVHAFGSLCATIDQQALVHNNILPSAMRNICEFLHAAGTAPSGSSNDHAIIKVLETLMMSLCVDEAISISAEPTITPLLLSAWSAFATSFHVCDGVTDIFHKLLSFSPASCISVQVRILPALESILLQNESNVAVSGTVAAALELIKNVLLAVEKHTRTIKTAQGISVTVAPSSPGSSAAAEFLHPLLFSSLLPLTMSLLSRTDDSTFMESCIDIVTAFLRIDSAKVAASPVRVLGSAAPVNGMQLLCQIINTLLDPKLADNEAINVGSLVVQVVFSLGAQLGDANIKELMKAVVARLHSSAVPSLNQSLLLVFARLIHSSSVESILGMLFSMGTLPVMEKTLVKVKKNATDNYASFTETQLVPTTIDALPYLLSKWMSASEESAAPYPTKVLSLALVKLLTYLFSSAPGAEALRNMECKGYVQIEKAPSGKRHTRAQTAAGLSNEPTYSKIPLTTKLVKIFLHEWKDWGEKNALEQKKEAKRLKRLARDNGQGGDDSEDESDFDDDDYEDDDDDDDDGDDDDFIAMMQAKTRGGGAASASPFASASDFPDFGGPKSRGPLMQLSDFCDRDEIMELDGEMEEETYPESLTDPINEVQLGPFLAKFLKEFAAANGGAFVNDAAKWLDDQDKKMLQTVIAAPAPTPATPKK